LFHAFGISPEKRRSILECKAASGKSSPAIKNYQIGKGILALVSPSAIYRGVCRYSEQRDASSFDSYEAFSIVF
jgi:hypothetical protein